MKTLIERLEAKHWTYGGDLLGEWADEALRVDALDRVMTDALRQKHTGTDATTRMARAAVAFVRSRIGLEPKDG